MKDRSHARGTARPPVTNTNVYVVASADAIGWAGPHPVDAGPGDQWFPTVAVNPKTNDVGVLYYDGNVDASGLYGDCLAEGRPRTFEIRPLTGPISNAATRFFASSLLSSTAVAVAPRSSGTTSASTMAPTAAPGSHGRTMLQRTRFEGRRGHHQQIYVTRRTALTTVPNGSVPSA